MPSAENWLLKEEYQRVRAKAFMGPIKALRRHVIYTHQKLSFIGKDPGFVQTRDQELSIALFKSIKGGVGALQTDYRIPQFLQ